MDKDRRNGDGWRSQEREGIAMRKLRQAVTLIKEWALETKHRVRGEHMLMAIHSELYDAGLEDQASVVVAELDELRHAPYETDSPLALAEAAKRLELARPAAPLYGSGEDRQ